jgi:peptidoglycan/xylan/chitin deacetylase (PgdA/CDA1 family)
MGVHMKTYRKFIRGSIYFIILIGVMWGTSRYTVEEAKDSQPSVNIEVVQELGNKGQLSEEVLKEAGKVYEQKRLAEKKRLEALANKNIGYSKSAVILMYHHIGDTFESYMSVPKEKFKEQMKYLKQNNFNIISLDELYSQYINGTSIPDNSVVLTFDDGYKDNYTRAYPILNELGFKATVFMITSKIDEDGYLTKEQIKELDSNGINIECHTVSHPQLALLSQDKQAYELGKSKMRLESILGRDIKYISYPYGEFNEDTIITVDKLSYKMGLATVSGKAGKANGIYTQRRIAISGKHDIEQFKTLLNRK